jgi:hypothetical protein
MARARRRAALKLAGSTATTIATATGTPGTTVVGLIEWSCWFRDESAGVLIKPKATGFSKPLA